MSSSRDTYSNVDRAPVEGDHVHHYMDSDEGYVLSSAPGSTRVRWVEDGVHDHHADELIYVDERAPLPSSDALLVLSEDGESVEVIDPHYEAPYTGCAVMPDAVALRMFRHEPAPVMTYDVGATPEERAMVGGTLLGLLGWVALLLCAYVGYRLTHSHEAMSVVGLPLARLRRERPAADEGEWYYAVALQGAFVGLSVQGGRLALRLPGGRHGPTPASCARTGETTNRCASTPTGGASARMIARGVGL